MSQTLFAAFGLSSIAEASTYSVKKGDTLSKIATLHGLSVAQLKKANRLSSDLIFENQSLELPTGSNHSLAQAIAATEKLSVPMRDWQLIVAHHSAIEQGNAKIYGRAHRRRGMTNGLAYHFVIGNGIDSGDGEIEVGERWLNQNAGGHVRIQSINDRGIGICLVGNFEKHAPSARQVHSLTQLSDYLKRYIIKDSFSFTTHREVDPGHTACPGRYFPAKKMHARYA